MQNALKRSKMGLEVWLVVYTKWNLDSHQRVALIGSRPYSFLLAVLVENTEKYTKIYFLKIRTHLLVRARPTTTVLAQCMF